MTDLRPNLDPDAVVAFSERMNALSESLAEGARRMGESLRRGLDQSAAGLTVDLGDFTQYVDDDGTHIDDSDICEDCGQRHGWTICREIAKTDGVHTCRGCEESWTETRGADAVDAVRWPGWFA